MLEKDDVNFCISFSLVLSLEVKWENAREKHWALAQHKSKLVGILDMIVVA